MTGMICAMPDRSYMRLTCGVRCISATLPPRLPETARQGTEFTRLLSEYGVKRCVYGHLHGQSVQRGFSGSYRGVRYDLVSCDALGFALKDVSLEAAEG